MGQAQVNERKRYDQLSNVSLGCHISFWKINHYRALSHGIEIRIGIDMTPQQFQAAKPHLSLCVDAKIIFHQQRLGVP